MQSGDRRQYLRATASIPAASNQAARQDGSRGPAYTSQTCNACGHADNADLNAARNIMASGIGASARRWAFASVTPATRETDRKLAA